MFIAHLDSIVMDYTILSYFLADHCKLKLQSSPIVQPKFISANEKMLFTFKKTADQQFFLLHDVDDAILTCANEQNDPHV